MVIVQKKRSTKHTFSFYDDYLNFAYDDKLGSGDRDITYADIPQKTSTQIEQNQWLLNVGYLWIVLGIVVLVHAYLVGAPLNGKGFWIFMGLVTLVWAYFTKIKYTVYSTEYGNVPIMQDKKHDDIIREINTRKKAQLLKWYGEINPENELNNEIKKFTWLAEQDVLTKEESEKRVEQVKLLHAKHNDGSQEQRLN